MPKVPTRQILPRMPFLSFQEFLLLSLFLQFFEAHYQQRNIKWAPVWARTIIVRNFIIPLYINASGKTAFYGIYVNESKPGQVNQVSSTSPLEETEIHPLVKDTMIKNMNNFPVTIIIGQKAIPKEIIIPANAEIVVGRGMSFCKLKNTDLLNVAEIMVTVTRKRNT